MKKLLALLLACFMVVSMAACGGGGSGKTDSSEPAATKDAETEGTKDTPSGEQRDLSLLCIYDESKVELYEMFDKFREEHPDINLEITAITSSVDINKQLTTLAVSGDLPDVVTIDRMYIAEFASMGIFEDLTELAESELDLSTYYEGPLEGCMADGKLYGMPFTSNCLAVYYNEDLLKAAGYDAPPENWTWEDYREIAMACSDPDNGVYGAVMSGSNNQDGTFQFYPWVWAAGGDILQPDSDATREALTYLTGLIHDGAMSPEISNWTQTDASNQFAGGKAALFTGGTWHLTAFEENISDFAWNVVEYPVNPNTGETATCLGGYGLCITKDGNVDDAWELVKFIESDEVMGYWNEYCNYIPVREDIAEASDYFSGEGKIAVYTESMLDAKSRGNHDKFIDIDTEWQAMLQEVYTGQMSVEEAVAAYAPKIDALVQ